MSDIRDLILNGNESINLDFKREPYVKEKSVDFLKDIMSMANALTTEKRYIILGVKDRPNADNELVGISEDKLKDSSDFQQLVRENISPTIDFSFRKVEVDGKIFGVYEINNTNNPPYMMKKDYKSLLKKGECWRRVGDQQGRVNREELDEILNFKNNSLFNGKVKLGFDVPDNHVLKVQTYYDDSIESSSMMEFYEDKFESFDDDELLEIIEGAGVELNLVIENESTGYLKDTVVEITFPKGDFKIFKELPSLPSGLTEFDNVRFTNLENLSYPEVKEFESHYTVKVEIGDLRHLQPTEIFKRPLRSFFFLRENQKTVRCPYKIFSEKLQNPLEGIIEIEIYPRNDNK